MAVASDYSGWVKELDHYEASMDDADDGDGRVESSNYNRRPNSRGSTISGIGTGRKAKPAPRPSVADELQQEMKLLNWHKLANEAALKAAIIKTNKIKTEDSRFANSLAFEDAEDKRQRIQQIIEEEQLRPLQVNTEFFRDFEAREQQDDVKVESDVQRHIQHLKRLKEAMAQREDLHRRRHRYKQGMAELKSYSVPKGQSTSNNNNQDDELQSNSTNNKRYQRSVSTAQKADAANSEVICSLDKLMELEKRIRHLEDAGLGVDGLGGSGGGANDGLALEDLDDTNVISTKNLRFSKLKSHGTSSEPSKTLFAVKTVTKARATNGNSSTNSSAPRKRSLTTNTNNKQQPQQKRQPQQQSTFLTSLPESKQRQLRRMTERERRNFLKHEKQNEIQQQQHKQDVVIQDWMQKKKQAAQQRKVTSHQSAQPPPAATSKATGTSANRRAAPLPAPPRVKPPMRGAAAGKHIANPHLQKLDDIRKSFDKRKEAMNKMPTTKNGGISNKVLDLRTSTTTNKKKPVASGATAAMGMSRGSSTLKSSTLGSSSSSSYRQTAVPGASHMPSAPPSYQRRPSGDKMASSSISIAQRLPAIVSRAPQVAIPAAQRQAPLTVGQRPGATVGSSSSFSSSSSSSSQNRPALTGIGHGLTLPKLTGTQRTGMAMASPSPPPASAKNPAMPQFSRLHKR